MTLIRIPQDYTFGTLSVAAAESDNTISSADFSALRADYTSQIVLPLVLHDPATGSHEVVWVTSHAANSQIVTVVRGKESTEAQPWPSGTQWICAPTAVRDGVLAVPAATLASITDAHIGMRAVETDTGVLKTMTGMAGLQADIGPCLPADCGHTPSGGSVPGGATILVRPGCVIHAASSSGAFAVTFARPFPNGILGAVAGSIDNQIFIGDVGCVDLTTSGFTARVFDVAGGSAGGPPVFASIFYVAFGW